MKILLTVVLLPVLICTQVYSQETTDDVELAFGAGSAKELVRYFNKVTEIKINNDGNNYTLAKAEPLLRNFFKENPPTSFNYIHKGQSPEGLKYNIAQYSSSEKKFRVVMLLKKTDEKYLISKVNINEE